jgi:hypothetical protein
LNNRERNNNSETFIADSDSFGEDAIIDQEEEGSFLHSHTVGSDLEVSDAADSDSSHIEESGSESCDSSSVESSRDLHIL